MGRFLAGFLSAIGLPEADAGRVRLAERVPLPARLAVDELAADAVGVLALAIEAARATPAGRSGSDSPIVLEPLRIAASFRSEQLGSLNGHPPDVWSPLSGFFPAGDGWVRTHANYRWHAEALAQVLGVSTDADRATASRAVAEHAARDLEAAAFAAGALAVAVRSAEEWSSERGAPAAPVVVHRSGSAIRRGARSASAHDGTVRDGTEFPLEGKRVLDLTRVIAGPVATRALAGLGADVLRVDAPDREEILWQWLDTGRGKRSTRLDLASRADRRSFDELLGRADALVTGARPGALARFGLEPEQLAETHPRLVSARVRAWSDGDPWGGRRGFDSLVQAATGIAVSEGGAAAGAGIEADEAPGRLPAQALDHSAGALLAAGVVALFAEGRAGSVEVTLEGIGRLLLEGGESGESSSARPSDAQKSALEWRPAPAPSAWGPLAIVGGAYLPLWQREPDPWAGRPWGEDGPEWAE